MIKIRNLKLDYKNFTALDIKNLDISTSQTTALSGFNGSGKSTLIKCISGLLKPSEGSIKIWDKELNKMSLGELKQIAVLLPEPSLLKRSVRENFKFALKSRNQEAKFNAIVPEVLELVGLDESFLDKAHFELSSGQNKRIAFALLLSLRARLNLLDEPTNAVDMGTSRLFSKAIEYVKEQHGSNFIIASHDEKWLSAISDENIFLHNGRVSEFELKNIFDAKDGAINFGDFSLFLPQKLKDAQKIAINQNLITINEEDAKFEGILHSVSLYFGNKALIKIKAGDFLLKCIVGSNRLKSEELATGKRVKFNVPQSAFLAIE
ncbi:tungstate ABC transporter ATP-binding protein TupC [Campylobacter sp. 7477a]|uniref:tungstate ABC transporter ATP-binding protein TupC n=1 Tax=Campylobacter sp. 7477a TaxID=2735741 RepID=UPI0030152539|nr:ATP-binding cassette domain-containing protein [Campylobacter sp. 7477a]